MNTLRFNTGTPVLTLTGTNALSAGGLLVGTGAGAVTIGGSGTLAGSAAGGTVAAPVLGELGIFQNSSGTLTISTPILNNAAGLSHVAATPSGTTLNKFGTGTLILSSIKNAYTGGTNIAEGILRLGASEVIPDGGAQLGAVTMATPATLDLNGFTETINGLAGAGTVDNTSATPAIFYVGNTNAASTFSGVIQNTGGASSLALTKIGTGALTLSGANTYGGTTRINMGSVVLNFTLAGAPASNIISSASALNLGSGTLTLTTSGAATVNSQAFSGTTLSGGSRVTQSASSALTIGLGSISRTPSSGGSVNVTLAGSGVATTSNVNDGTGILGSWVVVNSADFAMVNGSNQIVPYASYTAIAGATGAGDATQNALFNTGNSVNAATVDFNTIKMGTAVPSFSATTNILRLGAVGAILNPTGAAAASIGTVAADGILTAGGAANTPGELNLINWSANTLTINSAINNNGTGAVTLVKSGSGAVTLATANTYSGGLIINQGTVTATAANQISSATGQGLVLNGGTLAFNANASQPLALTLGAGGGTLTLTGAITATRNATAATAVGFTGNGPRTLTILTGVGSRIWSLPAVLGDGAGGPTSLTVNLANSSIFRLAAANSYTGTTTIVLGILDLNVANAISSGTGGLTSAATTGNIVFAATGTNRAILQTTVAAGTITRSLGYGDGQIHWEGNGGFSNSIGTTPVATQVVNLGGAGARLTWGAGGFVPTGSILQFGTTETLANGTGVAGAIDFQNDIDLGTVPRTVEVFTTDLNAPILQAILSGDLTSSAGGGLIKSGNGTLQLTGNNAAGTSGATVAIGGAAVGGIVLFSNVAAIPGSGANITFNNAVTNAAVGVIGDTNPISTLGGRIANPSASTSTGAFLLGADSSAALDFTLYPNMRLAGFAFTAGATPTTPAHVVTYTGTITPAGGTYRFGGTQNLIAASSSVDTLVLGGNFQLTGANSVDFTYGRTTITGMNDYSGTTTMNGNGVVLPRIGIGSNSAFGTSTVTLAGANNVNFGAVNGDHSVSNNIFLSAGSTLSWEAGADQGTGGILANTSQGTLSYLGTVDLGLRTNPTIVGRPRGTLFLGNITDNTTNINYTQGSGGYFSWLSTSANGGVAKTYSGTTNMGDNTVLVIDSDNSLGTGGNLAPVGTTASILQLQPGTAAIALGASRNITVTADGDFVVNTPAGSSLTVPGAISGATTGSLIKAGLGTLVLSGNDTAAVTTGALNVRAGTLRLDAATLGATVWGAGDQPLVLGVASGTFSNGGTLEITGTSAQSFGAVTVNAKANSINLTGAMALTLGAVTRTTGSTLNFSVPTGTVASTTVANAGLVNGATTWNGSDWAAANGTNISQYAAYTVLSGAAPSITSTAAANYEINGATGTVTLAAAGTLAAPNNTNTIKYSDAAARIIDVRTSGGTAGFLRLGTGGAAAGGVTNAGGILIAPGAGALTIGIAAGATGGTIMAGGTTTNTLGDLVFINNSGNPLTVNSAIVNNNGTTGITPVVISGLGTVILAGDNTATGGFFINSGVLEVATVNISTVAGPLAMSTAAVGNILLNGGTFRANLSADGNTNHGFTINAPSTIEVVANTLTLNTTLNGVATANAQYGTLNAGILKKTGAGTLELKDLATNATNANLSIEVAEGTLVLNKVTTSAISAVNLAGGAGLIVDSVAGGSARTVVISGTGGNQISDDSSVVVQGDLAVKGVFDLNGRNETIDGLAGTGIATNNAAGTSTLSLGGNNSAGLSPYTLAAAAAGVNATGLNSFGGVIQDGGAGKVVALTKTGSGTQILTGNNTYSGATTINAGTLRLGIANALPSGTGKGNVTIFGNNTGINLGAVATTGSNKVLAPGTLDMGGFNLAINGLDSTTGGYVVNNPTLGWNGSAWVASNTSNTLTLGSGDASGNFNGTLMDGYTVAPGAVNATAYTGTLGLTKTGTGTQTLSGTNTYTGTTTISNGTLAVSGSLSGTTAVTVSSGGALLLKSSTNADNIVNTAASYTGGGGTLAVDVSQSGRTNTFASMTLTANSTLDFGTGSNGTTTGNTLRFGGLATAGFTLDVRNWSGSFYDVTESADHGSASQDRLLFTTNPGFASNTVIPGISFFDDAGVFIGNGLQVSFDAQYEIVPVPEPATSALLGAVALCALIGYRSRRRSTGVPTKFHSRGFPIASTDSGSATFSGPRCMTRSGRS